MATKKDITEIKASISHLNESISSIRASIIDTLTNENISLKNRVRKLEIKIGEGQQYHRHNNIVISGIPAIINVSSRDIEATHRIGAEKKTTIVRFVNQKDAEQAIDAWKKLKELNPTMVGLVKGTKIFINENFSPFISKIGYMGRKLLRARVIHSTWMRKSSVF